MTPPLQVQDTQFSGTSLKVDKPVFSSTKLVPENSASYACTCFSQLRSPTSFTFGAQRCTPLEGHSEDEEDQEWVWRAIMWHSCHHYCLRLWDRVRIVCYQKVTKTGPNWLACAECLTCQNYLATQALAYRTTMWSKNEDNRTDSCLRHVVYHREASVTRMLVCRSDTTQLTNVSLCSMTRTQQWPVLTFHSCWFVLV